MIAWWWLGCAPAPLEWVEVDPLHDWDGDGFTETQGDCDDSDAAVSPVAVEVCDNEVDDDCDGELASCDDDGDGVTTAAGDCDDGDAAVFPGAFDRCGDGIDQDCSGDDAYCAWSGEVPLPPAGYGVGGPVWAVGDLDGSPGAELAVGGDVLEVLQVAGTDPVAWSSWSRIDDPSAGWFPPEVDALAVLPDGRLTLGVSLLDPYAELRGTLVLVQPSPGAVLLEDLLVTAASVRGDVQDCTGTALTVVDGPAGDLLVVGGYGLFKASPLRLVPVGSLPDGPGQERDLVDIATVELETPVGVDALGGEVLGVDLTGDGAHEVVGSTIPGILVPARVYVADASGPSRELLDEESLEASGPVIDGQPLRLGAGDLDGDGLSDLLVGFPGDRPGGPADVYGEGIVHVHRGAASSDAADWAAERPLGNGVLRIVGPETGSGLGAAVAAPGDVDGDGRAELWVGAPADGAQDRGAAYLVHADGAGTVDLGLDDDAVLARVQGSVEDRLGGSLLLEDLDQDGVDDLVLTSDSAVYGLLGSAPPVPGGL